MSLKKIFLSVERYNFVDQNFSENKKEVLLHAFIATISIVALRHLSKLSYHPRNRLIYRIAFYLRCFF